MFEKFPESEAWYTSSEIMDFWSISYSTLYRSIQKNKLSCIRLGKEKAYKGNDLNILLDDRIKEFLNE